MSSAISMASWNKPFFVSFLKNARTFFLPILQFFRQNYWGFSTGRGNLL